MLTEYGTWFCILTIFVTKSMCCTYETYWRKFPYIGPSTFNYYSLMQHSSVNLCIATCWPLHDWDQIYFQGEDCYCLAPVYEEASLVSGTVTTNSSIWTTYKDTNYCSEKGYTLFPDQKYCLKYVPVRTPWHVANTICQQDGGFLMSTHTPQDLANCKSLITSDIPVSIGGYKSLDRTEYVWLTGGTVNESLFYSGEPTDLGGNNQNCVAMVASGMLKDKACYHADLYMCQILTL